MPPMPAQTEPTRPVDPTGTGPHAPGPGTIVVRAMAPDDAEQVLGIYQAGLDGGDASFETTAPTWAEFDDTRLAGLRFVAVDRSGDTGATEQTDRVVGWVAATPVSDRCTYAGVVEHSVYVHPTARGQGIGTALLEALIAATERAGVWTIQSGVFPENQASLALHRRAGFEVVGVRKRLGRHHGRWRDVVFIERRSPVID